MGPLFLSPSGEYINLNPAQEKGYNIALNNTEKAKIDYRTQKGPALRVNAAVQQAIKK